MEFAADEELMDAAVAAVLSQPDGNLKKSPKKSEDLKTNKKRH